MTFFHQSSWHWRVMLIRIWTWNVLNLWRNVFMHLSVSSGILSQRMFVMLPCGGVGVRENIQTLTLCNSSQPIYITITASDERQYYLKKKATGHARENYKKDRILQRKREFGRSNANICLTVHVGPWQVTQTRTACSWSGIKEVPQISLSDPDGQ